MGVLERILGRLHRVFNKSPQRTPALTLVSSASVTASVVGLVLTITSSESTVTFDLSETTLADLADQINASALNFPAPIIEATAVGGMDTMLARAILPSPAQLLTDEDTLYYPTAQLYHEMQTYAWALEEQAQQSKDGSAQMYFHSATGKWLDTWCGRFGVERLPDCMDDHYLQRAIAEITRVRCNNLAIEDTIRSALGYRVDIRDLAATVQPVDPEDDTDLATFGVYIYSGNINDLPANDKAAIDRIVRKHKAAGTQAVYFAPTGRLITNDATKHTNSAGHVTGPAPFLWTEVLI